MLLTLPPQVLFESVLQQIQALLLPLHSSLGPLVQGRLWLVLCRAAGTVRWFLPEEILKSPPTGPQMYRSTYDFSWDQHLSEVLLLWLILSTVGSFCQLLVKRQKSHLQKQSRKEKTLRRLALGRHPSHNCCCITVTNTPSLLGLVAVLINLQVWTSLEFI